MALPTPEESEMAESAVKIPLGLATASGNNIRLPHDRPSSLNPVAKKRKLNYPAPASGSHTSACRWFDNVNQNVTNGRLSNSDLEPVESPFYLNRQPHGPTPVQRSIDPSFGDNLAQIAKEDTENQDLRGVIDDLTIENKRLRQMLRERRQQHDPILDHDKIIEVRTCDLSSEKKRELEAILRQFTSTISDASPALSKTPGDESALHGSSSALPKSTTRKTLAYPETDSAYASLSNSGLTSAGQSNETRGETQRMRGNKSRSKSSNIKSYLHDIPDSLLPKYSPIMSEKSKMRLVVKRLEQLFTGKNAAPGEHSQPLQQQKVSESAANADRHDSQLLNRLIRPEGAREAHIIPVGAKMDLDSPKVNSWYKKPLGSNSESEKSSDGTSAPGSRSPDQRPTRPLDLDIHRAQVAEENIEYIRHLGLPTPRYQQDSDHSDHGWLYLNLLINMAQLHTINVTPAFVRKSIAHLSTKFEMSRDARKVRWKGSPKNVDSADDSDSDGESTAGSSPELNHRPTTLKCANDNTNSDNVASTGSPNDRTSRTLQSSSSERNPCTYPAESSLRPSKVTNNSRPESAFDYKPIFVKNHAINQENFYYDDLNILASVRGIDETTGQDSSTPAHGMSHNNSGRLEDEGPTIYYKNPLFYCDMSGDKQAEQSGIVSKYPVWEQTLGAPDVKACSDEEKHEHGLSSWADVFNHSVDDDGLPSLDLSPLTETIDQRSNFLELAASGIGGVLPEDHFMLEVKRKHQRMPIAKARVALQACSNRAQTVIEERLVCSTRVDLQASTLPPPSYVFSSLSSGSSGGLGIGESISGDSDDSDVESLDEAQPIPPVLRRFPTDTSGKLCTTDEDQIEVDSYSSANAYTSHQPEHPDTDSEQGSEFDRAAVLQRPLGVLTGSLAATVGAGTAASIASSHSAASSRVSGLGRYTRP